MLQVTLDVKAPPSVLTSSIVCSSVLVKSAVNRRDEYVKSPAELRSVLVCLKCQNSLLFFNIYIYINDENTKTLFFILRYKGKTFSE